MDYDYIIVGAGSAGCVLAERLSADGRSNVLLLEQGGENRHLMMGMPKGVGRLIFDPKVASHTPTEAQPELGLKSEIWIRGKVIGGSSSINGMMYFRGLPVDYEDWGRSGAEGWNWPVVKRAFEEIERLNDEGDGPLNISLLNLDTTLNRAFIDAGKQMGVPEAANINLQEGEGVGFVGQSTYKGRRFSAADGFLKRARKRQNLRIETGVQVDRVIFDGKRAVGVAGSRGGQPVEYRCEREVILSAGGMWSPLILQRSGIGPADHLKSLGIDIVHDSPRVGKNVLEHLGLMMKWRLNADISQTKQFGGWRLYANVMRYFLTRGGPMSTPTIDVVVYGKTDPALAEPDIELTMSPQTTSLGMRGQVVAEDSPTMQIFGFPMRSVSQGEILIRSRNPADIPVIRPNYFTEEYDRKVSIAMVHYMRRWMSQPAIAQYVVEEYLPGPGVRSDDEILDFYRQAGQPNWHACGAVAMGGEDAPLDGQLRVRGVQGLRVIDGSAMPTIPSTNVNGSILAMSWHAASLVLKDRNV